ncbi:hypothetical protein LZK82_24825 (plasmid) [Rhizobium leguminosarum]|uniref:hypothetical protein n=1 Tax=Rhizobium leguminosarum TaxID=384 RepID=UPI0004889E4A|nr:hypothetical protein [Rhizobium leguminosarum]UIK01290.1 hypothetical protein LZK82_24825 [Rhizobium leguminosarum]UIK14206.1 hypothetical protein LZK80_30460 [Rhizobium leguminosarum]UIL30335.1 hypothetical protein LZK75_25150 [Rhizobium leguminosarum]WFT90993.1 hypothetical protein QA638_36920 [Rhizobium leguminosarum]
MRALQIRFTAGWLAEADWTVRALAADLKAAGINISHDTVWRFPRCEGKTFERNADRQRSGQAHRSISLASARPMLAAINGKPHIFLSNAPT